MHLTPQQARILEVLLVVQPRILTRSELISALWPDPDDEPGDPENIVDVQICRLRRVLGPGMISTFINNGYRLERPAA